MEAPDGLASSSSAGGDCQPRGQCGKQQHPDVSPEQQQHLCCARMASSLPWQLTVLFVVASALLASPKTPPGWGPEHSTQLVVAMAVLEAGVLFYFNSLLQHPARHALAAAVRLVPKAAAVLAALLLQPHTRLPLHYVLQPNEQPVLGTAHALLGLELLWNCTIYALPLSLHVPVALLEWLLLAYTISLDGGAPACSGGAALLQAGLAVIITAPLSVVAQHMWARARALHSELQRGPSSTPLVEISLDFTPSMHNSKGTSFCTDRLMASEASDLVTMPAEALPAAHSSTATAARARSNATSEMCQGASEGSKVQGAGTLADAVQRSLQLACSHAAARDAAHEAHQRQQALQHVAQVMGADVAALVAASVPAGTEGVQRPPMPYVGRCRLEPMSFMLRQPAIVLQADNGSGTSLDHVASVVIGALEAGAANAAGCSLSWHMHATCVTGARRAVDATPASHIGSTAATRQHEQLLSHVNELLASGLQSLPALSAQ